ncbi:MAG: bacteriohemerythrin [Bacteriovoracaceae bacterium]
MNDLAFNRWLLHTSREWDAIRDILRRTHIPSLDQDHKQLARYTLDLNLILEKIQKKEITVQVLEEERVTLTHFLQYTEEHFQREESIMNLYNLPQLKSQEIDHEQALDYIKGVVHNLQRGKIIFTQDLKNELLDWIIHHTNHQDYEALHLRNFKHHFQTAKTLEDLKLFINYTGVPTLDKEIVFFLTNVLSIVDENLNTDGLKKKLSDSLRHFNSLTLKTKTQYSIHDIREDKYQDKLFDQYFLKSLNEDPSKRRGEIIYRSLVFIAREIQSDFDLVSWAPKYLEGVNDFENMTPLIKHTGISEIDQSLEDILIKCFESYQLYQNKNKSRAMNSVSQVMMLINKHLITTDKYAKKNGIVIKKYHTENLKRLRKYLDKVFLHVLESRLEFTISLRNKILFHCISQNNFHDYSTLVERPLEILEQSTGKPDAL